MLRIRYMIAVAALTALLAACGGSSQSGPQSASFPERDITFVVPYSPGGGYDTLARGLAPYIQKHLPKKVNVVVENRKGAGGQTGTAYVHKAKPDGYTIVLSNVPGLIAGQIISDKKNYDLSEFTWLGRVTTVNNGIAVAAKSPFKTVDDLKKKGEVLFAGADLGDAATAYLAFAKMGIKARYLPHNGSGEATTSVLRGDADFTYFSLGSLLPHVKSGDLRVLVQFKGQPIEGIDAPTSNSIGLKELTDLAAQQRVIGAPPGVPAAIASVLESTLNKAVADPEFQKWAASVKQPVAWLSAKETAALVKEATVLMNSNSATLKQNLGQK